MRGAVEDSTAAEIARLRRHLGMAQAELAYEIRISERSTPQWVLAGLKQAAIAVKVETADTNDNDLVRTDRTGPRMATGLDRTNRSGPTGPLWRRLFGLARGGTAERR
jgi:DNA-binding transcriptional regulator LsrR (DeoR family)